MRKKVLAIAIFLLVPLCSFAQEHISFNGATFGVSRSIFLSSMNRSESALRYVSHTYKDMYNRHFLNNVKVNTYDAHYYIHSSIKTGVVFEAVAWFKVTDLKEELKLYVKALQAKYGAHVSEQKENLGEITSRYWDHSKYASYREMLAMIYTVRNSSTGKAIGEIRISAAPSNTPTYDGDSGYIELTYRDYAAAELAKREYNATLHSIL